MRSIAAGLTLTMCAACAQREPPAPDGSPSVAVPEFAAPPAATAPQASTSPRASAAPAALTAAPAAASTDPSLLPQTHDSPHASGPVFDARVAALWDAIVHDDPDRAIPFFFPVGAYQQVKDVPDPAADWKHRLVAAYRHDIHALHAQLSERGDDAQSAKLDGLDVPDGHARWVEPGEEYNKIGYYRVFGSRLRYEVGGRPGSFDVKSLISWRGEWFVVHLSAIK